MSSIKYDVAKLKRLGEINIEHTLKNYEQPQEYFQLLTKFVEDSKNYLSDINPVSVITSEDSRKEYLIIMKDLRNTLTTLGMASAAFDIKYLENAAFNRDSVALENELSEFNSRLESIAKFIDSSRIVEAKGAEKEEKPVVLAVDDKVELLSSVVGMLRDKFTVMAVTSGKAALKVIEKNTPALFLLDLEMPEMDGYELTALIRKIDKFSHTPIIFLTAKGTKDNVVSAIKYGGNDFIVKPVEKNLLVSKIESHLE